MLSLHLGLRPKDLVAKNLTSESVVEVVSTSTSSYRSASVVGSALVTASGSLRFSLFSSALPEQLHFGCQQP